MPLASVVLLVLLDLKVPPVSLVVLVSLVSLELRYRWVSVQVWLYQSFTTLPSHLISNICFVGYDRQPWQPWTWRQTGSFCRFMSCTVILIKPPPTFCLSSKVKLFHLHREPLDKMDVLDPLVLVEQEVSLESWDFLDQRELLWVWSKKKKYIVVTLIVMDFELLRTAPLIYVLCVASFIFLWLGWGWKAWWERSHGTHWRCCKRPIFCSFFIFNNTSWPVREAVSVCLKTCHLCLQGASGKDGEVGPQGPPGPSVSNALLHRLLHQHPILHE